MAQNNKCAPVCAPTSAQWLLPGHVVLHTAGYRAHAMKTTNPNTDEIIVRVRLILSSPRSVKIWKAGVKQSDTGFICPLSKETPQPVEPIRAFFSSTKWQPCCRQPGSPAAVCAEGRGVSGPSLFPLCTPAALRTVVVVFSETSRFVLVTGDQPCGLKSKRSCHRNAQVSPQSMWHT